MPYKVDWYIENEVVFVQMWGSLELADYVNYFKDCYTAYDQSDRPMVHTIIDASRTTHNPNLLEIKRSLPKETHPRAGWILSVVDGPKNVLTRFVVNTVSNVTQQRLRHFNKLDEALTFLQSMDASVSWDLAHPEVLQPVEVLPAR
ncbi:MAG TPA: hypothetical protein PLQ56_14195 [Aggregatilineales bacterium]|nr:hypothetical protein [Aggregatilineales bacterium]